MKWEEDAQKALEILPVPPMMGGYAKIQAEKIARQRGVDIVTTEIVSETKNIYRDFIGEEKTSELEAFYLGKGPEPTIEEELFFDNEGGLYTIEACFTKYGENSDIVRDALKDMMHSAKAIMAEENLTEIMADLATLALHGASRFNLVMTGCPNCCVSPFMKDFGIIMQHRVEITDSECTSCGNCLKMCFDHAIQLTDQGPVIDRALCGLCELCARDCPTGRLVTRERGFKVVAGGRAGRHPSLAKTIEPFVDKNRVLVILKNAIAVLRNAQPGETLAGIIEKQGTSVIC